jgi:Cu/Ag efflux pump CusA
VTANVSGRDLRGAAEEVRAQLAEQPHAAAGHYRAELGGEFESEASASRTIVLLSVVALVGYGGCCCDGVRRAGATRRWSW